MCPTTNRDTLAPHSTEAERTVLGALLIDGEAFFEISPLIKADDFYDPAHRCIYATMQNISEEGTTIDFLTVSNKMDEDGTLQKYGGQAFLANLTSDLPTSAHIRTYAEIVIEKGRRRQLAEFGRKVLTLASENQKSAHELTEIAEREFLKLTTQASAAEPTVLSDLRHERFEQYVRLYESDDDSSLAGIRTGFADLDDKLTVLAPGQLIVLAGRPGMGKTALALDIARNVAHDQGKVVAIFSLEMSKEEVFDRLFAKSLGIGCWKLSKGMLSEKEFSEMGSVLDEFNDFPLYIDDDANSDLMNLRSKARRHQMRHGLDLLIVDYLQLIEVTDRSAGENQTQRITHISKSLKRLARELQCPVLAISQLSRECDRRPDKRPQLSDLRDSGSIEQDGDRILMLYRESEYFEDAEDPNQTDLFIRKNRHGPTGSIQLHFDKERMSFRDVDS